MIFDTKGTESRFAPDRHAKKVGEGKGRLTRGPNVRKVAMRSEKQRIMSVTADFPQKHDKMSDNLQVVGRIAADIAIVFREAGISGKMMNVGVCNIWFNANHCHPSVQVNALVAEVVP